MRRARRPVQNSRAAAAAVRGLWFMRRCVSSGGRETTPALANGRQLRFYSAGTGIPRPNQDHYTLSYRCNGAGSRPLVNIVRACGCRPGRAGPAASKSPPRPQRTSFLRTDVAGCLASLPRATPWRTACVCDPTCGTAFQQQINRRRGVPTSQIKRPAPAEHWESRYAVESQERELSESPMLKAFWRVAPSVLLSFLAIC